MGVLSTAPTLAQQTGCDDCTGRYVELAKSRGLQAEIDYLLPSDTLDLDQTKRKRESSREDSDVDLSTPGRIGWLLISGAILLGIAIVIYQNSSGGLVSFASKPTEGSRKTSRHGSVNAKRGNDSDLPTSDRAFLAEIEGMTNRREALHLLAGRLLANAAEKAQIRPGRSWTARESLRALPSTWVHMADLRHLNRQAELAWFGGRHVEDSVFEDCLNRARTMMRAGPAQ